jgi:hypothetical protein
MTISASMFGAAPGPMFGIVASDYYSDYYPVKRQRRARRAFGENAFTGRAARRTDWLVPLTGNRGRFNKHPDAAAIELDDKAVRGIDGALVPGLRPNVA